MRWNYTELAHERKRRWEDRRRIKEIQRQERERLLFDRLPRLAAILDEERRLVFQMAQAMLRRSTDIARIQEQGQALTAERAAILQRSGIAPDELEMQYDCPACKDTGWIEPDWAPGKETVTPAVKCECLRREEVEDLYKASGLTGPLRNMSFQNFDLKLFPAEGRRYMSEVLSACRQFARDAARGAQMGGLLLYGDVGTGKTFLATAIANEVLAAGRSVIYATWAEYLDVIRLWRLSDDLEERTALHQLLDSHLVVLDDLGTEKVTEFVGQELFNLINHRLNNHLPTVISSNLPLKEIEEIYGSRVASRLIYMYQTIEFRGADLRRQLLRKGAIPAPLQNKSQS